MALICVGCDIPSSRTLCGFLGHSATAGCNKCRKKFPGGVGGRGIMEVFIELHELVGKMKVIRKSATCYKIVPAKVKEKVLKETLAHDTQLLCDEDFKLIQEKMEQFQCPSDIGKLPKKFSSSYGSFNEVQFMLFVICYHWNILTVGKQLF